MEERELAFHTICNMISQSGELRIPLPEDVFSLVTDASGLGIGAVLQVWRDEQWEAAAFFSRQIRGAEQRYLATELEALALVESVKHFSYYLYGRVFTAYTDHKPLCQLLTSDRLNPRLRKIAMKMQHWLVSIEYLPGRENGFADALSREERKRVTPAPQRTDVSLAVGDVGAPTPYGMPARETRKGSTQAKNNENILDSHETLALIRTHHAIATSVVL